MWIPDTRAEQTTCATRAISPMRSGTSACAAVPAARDNRPASRLADARTDQRHVLYAAWRHSLAQAGVIDTQSVKTTEAGGVPRGYDAGKKIKGRKRHGLVDTDGRGLELQVHPACVQDRDGAPPVLQASRARFPFIQTVFADSVYTGERHAKATTIAIEIVRRLPDQVGFQVLPPRWVVERFLA